MDSERKTQGIFLSLVSAGVFVFLSSCTTYQPHPLMDESPLALSLEELTVNAVDLSGGVKREYHIDLTDDLDLTETGVLAAINNPDLKAQRARLQVAEAQAFAAGLLPDPQLGVGFDNPMNNSAPTNAWALGLGYDIIPLITRRARVDAERMSQEKVRLDLLWQEWQVIQQARSLAVRLLLEKQSLALLTSIRVLYERRYERSFKALSEGDVTLDVNGTDLTALVDTLSQINQLEQAHNQTRHRFNLLLGLEPQVMVAVAMLPELSPVDPEFIKARLTRLPDTRPDLLALKAGYESQEAQVRAAILAQFPSLGVGIGRARDTDDVNTFGVSVNLTLPLFSGNKGNIAIERATREQLQTEYHARLAQAAVDVDELFKLQLLVRKQQENLQTYLPRLKTLVERARRAYQRGDIDALTFLNMESTWVNKRLEQIKLTQVGWETQIALEALLALPGYPENPIMTYSESRDTES